MERALRIRYLSLALLACLLVLGLQAATAEPTTARATAPGEPYPGNTLISIQDYKFDGRLIEVTPDGEVVWEFDPPNSRVFDSEQLDNGNVLVAVATKLPAAECPPETLDHAPDTCVHNRVLELEKESKEVVWKYTWYDAFVTHHEVHDVDRLPNGETAVIDMGNNRAFTVNRQKEITWIWHAEEHLGSGTEFHRKYGGPENQGPESDWTHMNDIDRLDNGNYQLSIRNFDVLVEVDPDTNEIVDVIGRPGNHEIMFEQHNPHRLERWGTVLVADSQNDRVVELDAKTGEVVWSYGGSDLIRWPRDADRLPNGNTLIVDTFNNRVIEINPQGEIVWEYEGVSMPYAADRLGLPEEPDDVPPGWQLRGKSAQSGAVVGTLRQVEAWAAFVFPSWVRLPELLTLSAATLVGLFLLVDLSLLGWTRWRS